MAGSLRPVFGTRKMAMRPSSRGRLRPWRALDRVAPDADFQALGTYRTVTWLGLRLRLWRVDLYVLRGEGLWL